MNNGSSTSSVESTDRIPDGSGTSSSRGTFPRLKLLAARVSGSRSTRAGPYSSIPTSRESDREGAVIEAPSYRQSEFLSASLGLLFAGLLETPEAPQCFEDEMQVERQFCLGYATSAR